MDDPANPVYTFVRSHAACNLLTTLSYPPWTKSLDRVMYMTPFGEECIPFHAYVQPSDTGALESHDDATFGFFSQLPGELQLRVLAMCPTSTLFQLMHTSSKLRFEASKLFWATPNTYFQVDAYWLVTKAYPGRTFLDTNILAQVRNVEVNYLPELNNDICERGEDGRVKIQHDLVDIFWESLQNSVLNVKRVLVIYYEEYTNHLEFGFDRIPLAVRLLVRAAPHSIESSVVFLEKISHDLYRRHDEWQRCSLKRTKQGVMEETSTIHSRKTVLMPPKRFNGPVGNYARLMYQYRYRRPLQEIGLHWLVVEALDRHHFDMGRNEPFSCPLIFLGCTASFSKGGEWTSHVAKEHLDVGLDLILDYFPSSSVDPALRERSQALDRQKEESRQQLREMWLAWDEGDEAERGEIQRSWVEQLSNDAAWETEQKGLDSHSWAQYMRDVYNNLAHI